QVRTQFVRNVAHRIDTDMVQRLARSSSRLREMSDTTTIPTLVRAVFDVGEEYGAMMENILKYYQSVNGSFVRVDGPLLVRNVVSDAIVDAKTDMSRVTPTKPVVDVSVGHDVPVSELIGDGPVIKECLRELVFNALRHDDDTHVSVDVHAASQDPYVIRFSVKNGGGQLRDADLEEIFTPFQNLSKQGVKGSGVGLGLARCKRMAQELGGELSVENGAEVTFSLTTPLAHDKDVVLQQEGGIEISYGRGDDKSRGDAGRHGEYDIFTPAQIYHSATQPSVLVVDDSAVARLQLKKMLTHVDITVDCCDGPLKCLDMARRRTYDLICLDIIMVGMTGITCAEHLRRGDTGNNRTPIVLITADSTAATRQLCAGIADSVILEKPVQRSVLLRTITSSMKSPSALEWIRQAWYKEDESFSERSSRQPTMDE
ncbi:unnamed protein product, partial [Pylaiella littoralis]